MGFVRKKTEQATNLVSDAASVATDIVKPVIQTVDAVVVKPVVDTVGDIYMEVRDPLQAAAVVAGNYVVPGSAIITSQLVSDDVKQMLATDIGKAAVIGSGIAGSGLLNSADPNAVGGVTGPDNIDVGGGFNPAGVVPAAPITAEAITQQIATPAAEQIAAENAAMQMTAEQFAAEQAAAAEAARIAAENAAYDQAMQDLAKNYVSPQFATSAAAQGLTFKQALDATRAGLLINAITGDPLGLNDVGGSAGNNFAIRDSRKCRFQRIGLLRPTLTALCRMSLLRTYSLAFPYKGHNGKICLKHRHLTRCLPLVDSRPQWVLLWT